MERDYEEEKERARKILLDAFDRDLIGVACDYNQVEIGIYLKGNRYTLTYYIDQSPDLLIDTE